MVAPIVRSTLRNLALNHGIGVKWFMRLCRPTATENAQLWAPRLHSMGTNVGIVVGTQILDPQYVSIGSNVLLANCTLICHDASVAIINRVYGVKVDRVGKIVIHDNVFIGHAALIMPGVEIGPNAVVAAGAVVTRNVPPNSVVAGVPARKVRSLDETAEKLVRETAQLPWSHIIQQREGAYDADLEPELKRLRIAHFFPKDEPPR